MSDCVEKKVMILEKLFHSIVFKSALKIYSMTDVSEEVFAKKSAVNNKLYKTNYTI